MVSKRIPTFRVNHKLRNLGFSMASSKRVPEAAVVRVGEKRVKFGDGMPVSEALGHIADGMFTSAAKVDIRQGEVILPRDAKLSAGEEYQVSLRIEGLTQRHFIAGYAVDPSSEYFIEPDVEDLVKALSEGKYSVLCGARQTGKSTMVQHAIRRLEADPRTAVVYLDGFETNKTWTSQDLWKAFWEHLQLKRGSLFHKPPASFNSSAFRSWFHKANLKQPVTLVLDEANCLESLSPDVISEFLSAVRAIKNDKLSYNLRGFMLIGVETIKDLLEAQYDKRRSEEVGKGRVYAPGSTPSPLSPFPHDQVLKSHRFTLAEVECLLQQAADERPGVELDCSEIAKSIFQWTGGHKGLTGSCLAYLVNQKLWTLKKWISRVDSYLLASHIFGQATYSRILEFIRSESSKLQEARRILAFYLQAEEVICEDPKELVRLRDFIAHGVLVADPLPGDLHSIRIATPLLRTAILRECTISAGIQLFDRPPPGRLNREWVILQCIQALDGETMTKPECQNSRGPSEYLLQFLFMCRLKAVLAHAYPMLGSVVLPEVKEAIVPGQVRSQMRLDTLVRDGNKFPRFAFEMIANGGSVEIREHMARAVAYSEQHSAQVFVINFCMDRDACTLLDPHDDNEVFVSVNFNSTSRTADVTFVYTGPVKKPRSVALKHWDYELSFDQV